jgi:hypothetical protein
VDDVRVLPASDVAQDHPHACLNGYVFLGYTGEDGEEYIEALPCRRCAVRSEELPSAIFEDERKLGRPHTEGERKAFTDGYFSTGYNLTIPKGR